jgi:DMSO/TMAO reductase YedYZ molybdopterin-dependent catalytic subunit
VAAAVTGALAFGIGATWVRWVVAAHAVAGLAIVALAPWKSAISARGLRRRRRGVSLSLLLAGAVVVTILTGLGHSMGVLRELGPVTAMQVHVGAAVLSVLLAAAHVATRRTLPARTDLSRRNLLRAGVLVGGTTVGVLALETLTTVTGLPGSRRRVTGSYERGSFRPDAMPVTQWLNDAVPVLDAREHLVVVEHATGVRRLSVDELLEHHDVVRATLDCTGGWYAEQDWEGVRVAALLDGIEDASSIDVISVTGYGWRLPADDAGRLLLATRVGGRALSAGHGFPVRLVAPGRRGFWWVKWVARVSLSDAPWWWQPPFPLA